MSIKELKKLWDKASEARESAYQALEAAYKAGMSEFMIDGLRTAFHEAMGYENAMMAVHQLAFDKHIKRLSKKSKKAVRA